MNGRRILLWIAIVVTCIGFLLTAASVTLALFVITDPEDVAQLSAALREDTLRAVRTPIRGEITVQEREAERVAILPEGLFQSAQGVTGAMSLRPPTVEVDAGALSTYVQIDSCLITGSDKVTVRASSPGLPRSDDKLYYLFDMAMYEDGISAEAEPLAKTYKDSEVSFDVRLKKGQTDSRLYRKFQLAVRREGQYVPVSHASYVTNPEAVAGYNYAGVSHSSKKGLLVDPFKTAELTDLGVQYATYNIPLNRILSTSAAGSTAYSYGGVTYYFNNTILGEYDHLFQLLNSKGIDVAAIILNNATPAHYPEITHPSGRSGSTAPYYMFNAEDEAGVRALSAIGSFLAGRYSGSGHGRVSMWIIGNEVNARKEWNYMAKTDLASYTAAYTRAFRVFYNAIKSVNAGAKVYVPFDQQWDRNRSDNPDYDARDMMDLFASSLRAYGDIDWGLAEHPYSYPNNNTAFWNPSKLVTKSFDTSILTMDNIEVLSQYMEQPSMRAPNGEVRSIILSEMGYSSTSGEPLQAAAFAYAYKKIEANPHIDAMMLSRQTDAADEIAAFGLALGLSTTGGRHKQIYEVYKYIDTSRSSEVTAFAKSIVGVDF